MINLKVLSKDLVLAEMERGFKFTMPICPISDKKLNLIAFDSMGKMDLIFYLAKELVNDFYDSLWDVKMIVCPEAKAIPLAQELARVLKIEYFVLRKNKKLYMKKPTAIEVESITTKGPQFLWYDQNEVNDRFDKSAKVLLLDDVVSTGSSMRALESFAADNELTNVVKAAVFLEGESYDREGIISLGKLPLISDDALEYMVANTN